MALLNCKECNKEISIHSKSCPNCGSTKSFKGYVFTRSEAINKGLNGYSDFRNFDKMGGKVLLMSKKTKYIILGIIAVLLFWSYYKDATEPRELVKFEGKEFLVRVSTKDLLSSLKDVPNYDYDELYKIYKEISSKESKEDFFTNKKNYYEKIKLAKYDCISQIENRDKSGLLLPDSYNLKKSSNKSGQWISKDKYYYEHIFSVKNAFGVEVLNTTINTCIYNKDFNIIKIVRQ